MADCQAAKEIIEGKILPMMSLKAKHILLSIHITMTAVWLGGLVVILVLLAGRISLRNGDEIASLDRALFQIHDIIILNASFAFVYTGLLFSLFTKWGFTKFYWVILKWLGLILLSVIVTFASAPAINGMAARSDVLREAVRTDPAYLQYTTNVVVFSLLQLLLIFGLVVLSIFKPWGQQRQLSVKVSRRMVIALGGIAGIALGITIWLQYGYLQSMRQTPVPVINLMMVRDGVYQGESNFGDFRYVVETTVQDHQITQIDVLQNRSEIYPIVASGIVNKVLAAQSVQVDTVTGATTTSKALLIAIANGLLQGVEGAAGS